MSNLNEVLQGIANIATTLGILIALFVFLSQKKEERRRREVEAYIRSTDRYIQYLTLCLDHPETNSFDPDTINRGVETPRLIMFSILICVFETAFLSLRRDAPRQIQERQWKGWENYITMWAGDEDFIRTWDTIGVDFDSDFQAYMNKRMTSL